MPAKLPPELIEAPRRYLRELQVGEECGINFTDLRVDKQGYGYLDRTATISLERNMFDIAVRRDASGYHVVIEQPFGTRLTFPRKPGFWYIPFRRWIPVESFTEIEEKKRGAS